MTTATIAGKTRIPIWRGGALRDRFREKSRLPLTGAFEFLLNSMGLASLNGRKLTKRGRRNHSSAGEAEPREGMGVLIKRFADRSASR
jgi:hypothetical protein